MTPILVTGGTGALGRPTVDHLVATGHQVRILSRRASVGRTAGPEWVTGDLTTGVGLPAAVEDVGTVVHLATSLGRRDVQHARNLLAVLPRTTHLVLMSITGIDRIPMPYYRTKLAVERLVADSWRAVHDPASDPVPQPARPDLHSPAIPSGAARSGGHPPADRCRGRRRPPH